MKFINWLAVLVLVGSLCFPFFIQDAYGRGGGGGGGGGYRGAGGFSGGSFHSGSETGFGGGSVTREPGGGELYRGSGGGEVYRGPEGGTAVKGPGGYGAAVGPYGSAVKTPEGTYVTRDNPGYYYGGAAVGSFVYDIPDSAVMVGTSEGTYYVDNNIYYQPCFVGSDTAYCVVNAPE